MSDTHKQPNKYIRTLVVWAVKSIIRVIIAIVASYIITAIVSGLYDTEQTVESALQLIRQMTVRDFISYTALIVCISILFTPWK